MRFDWLISSPSKAVLDRQKGVLNRNSKVYFNKQTKWTKKIFTQVLDFLNESFTLNEIEQLKKFPSNSWLHSRKTQICSALNLEKALIFDYGYTIKLLLTN